MLSNFFQKRKVFLKNFSASIKLYFAGFNGFCNAEGLATTVAKAKPPHRKIICI